MLDTHARQGVGIEIVEPAEGAAATAARVGEAFTLEPDQDTVIFGGGRRV
jgi:hypothetical protein